MARISMNQSGDGVKESIYMHKKVPPKCGPISTIDESIRLFSFLLYCKCFDYLHPLLGLKLYCFWFSCWNCNSKKCQNTYINKRERERDKVDMIQWVRTLLSKIKVQKVRQSNPYILQCGLVNYCTLWGWTMMHVLSL